MDTQGYIKINRKITKWRWYKKPTTFRMFIHLMFKANYADTDFEIYTIKRGQLVTTRRKLAEELNISEREVRTAIKHLQSTNDIAVETTSKYSIITVVDYEKFQEKRLREPVSDQQVTSKRPTSDRPATIKRPQYNKNNKKKKNNKGINNYPYETDREYLALFDSKSVYND